MSDLVELTAGQWGHGGVCVSRLEGRVVLLRLALPGERVVARVTQRRARFWRAEVVDVLDASPDRVPHPWPAGLAAGVGGMDLAHVAPAAARAAKAQVIGGQLTHALSQAVPVEVAAVGDAGPLGWRTRLDLAAGPDGWPGMFQSRSNQVVRVTEAPMAVPAIADLALFDRQYPPGRVTAVAPSAGPAFVVGDGQTAPRRQEEVQLADGRSWRYSLDGRGFWQAHYLAPATLVAEVMQQVGEVSGAVVWDLYCGAGLFTLPLAEAVGPDGRVVGVEAGRQALSDARVNLSGLDQAQLVRAGVDRFAGREAAATMDQTSEVPSQCPDVVVLDPPRAGAGLQVVRELTTLAPPLVVYVSCEVSTLARDLAGLVAGGYRLAGVAGFDLFPGTWHAETVTTLKL